MTTCHSRTRDLAEVCRRADVLIAAVGKPGLVRGDWVKEGAVVIDVGINRTEQGLTGDVEFDGAAERARLITPGARRRRPDDDRDAAAQHARGGPHAGRGAGVDLRRLRAGEWLAAAGGVLLIVSLLLPWYEGDSGDVTGFEALTVIDVLLAVIAVLAIVARGPAGDSGQPGAARRSRRSHGDVRTHRRSLLVLFRLVDQPEDDLIGLGIGAWLGLAATVAIAAGGWLSIANEHVRGLPPGPRARAAPDARGMSRAASVRVRTAPTTTDH